MGLIGGLMFSSFVLWLTCGAPLIETFSTMLVMTAAIKILKTE